MRSLNQSFFLSMNAGSTGCRKQSFMIAIAVAFLSVAATANAQMMMGHGMGGNMGGGMMGAGHMRSMQELMAWMQGADIAAVPTHPQPRFDAQSRAQGKVLYLRHCAICHGENGDGNGRRSRDLSPHPRDFTTGLYEFRSTPTGALPSDEDIWKTISGGLHGTAMVPWISLSEDDRWALVSYIEGFSPRFARETRPASIAVTPPTAETPQLIASGEKLFDEAGCVQCHGSAGHGDGPAAPTLKDASGQPIHPLDFSSGVFRRGASLESIFLTVRTGLNGTPMPSYADSLTPEQTWAIAAYVRSLTARQDSASAEQGHLQERLGMSIDMPGMAAMGMSPMMPQ
jgi:mono/diheme cytochrome c family protein